MYSRHNSSYWTGKKYLGCGPSAHSYNGVSRQWNISSLDEYITNINEGEPYSEIEELNLYTRYNDFVITTIRTMWGMNLDMLKKHLAASCTIIASVWPTRIYSKVLWNSLKEF